MVETGHGGDGRVRALNLANLFTALGHVTHLLADASVPDHARNDTHILRSYETWCQENLVTVDDAVYGVPVFRDAFGPQPAIFEQDRGEAFGSGPLSRVSNLWDSQAAPGVNRHLGVSPRLVGLADYSNHDYFSGDTVFATYPHPAAGEATLNLYAVPLPEGGTEERLFFSRTTSDGVFVRFLAAAGLLACYRPMVKSK